MILRMRKRKLQMLRLLKNNNLFSLEGMVCFFMCFFVAFVVFPLKFLVFSSNIYYSGEFSPFSSHYLYAADVCFLFGLLFCGLNFAFSRDLKFNLKNIEFDRNLLFLSSFFVIFTSISLFFSVNIDNSLFSLLRLFEFFVLYLLLVFEIVSFKPLIFTFLGAMFLSSLIGIFQFILQHSIGVKLLGESVISNSMAGVAKLDIFDFKILRAYGTFSHPNVFSGFLIIALIFVYIFHRDGAFSRKFVNIFALFVLFSAFILTFSKATLVAFLFLVFFIYWRNFSKKLKIFLFGLIGLLLVLLLLSQVTILERVRFLAISEKLFWSHPFGVGIGNFTESMSQFSYYKLFPWNYQPVHNVFLLVLNEVGFPGFMLFLLIFTYGIYESLKYRRHIIFALFFVLMVISLFDHYLFSLYQGQFLFWFIMAYVTCSHSGRLKHP